MTVDNAITIHFVEIVNDSNCANKIDYKKEEKDW